MTSAQILQLKRRHRDGFGIKLGQRLSQTRQIGGISVNGEVGIAAKLGRAVKHASLSAHEQGADVVRTHRRRTLRIGFGIK